MKRFLFIIITLLGCSILSINGYANRVYDNRGFPYQSANSPTNFRPSLPVRPQPNYYQTHHINTPPNTIYLNRPTHNTIFLNKPNAPGNRPVPAVNPNYSKHNFYVPYVIYYSNSIYPYYPTTYGTGDFSGYSFYDIPSISVSEISSSISSLNQSIPNGIWVQTSEGSVPEGAIVYETRNNADTYYCRATYNNIVYYGVLIRGEGCYIQDGNATIRFTQYLALVAG